MTKVSGSNIASLVLSGRKLAIKRFFKVVCDPDSQILKYVWTYFKGQFTKYDRLSYSV